jgi:hypothetical protein
MKIDSTKMTKVLTGIQGFDEITEPRPTTPRGSDAFHSVAAAGAENDRRP